MNANTILHGLRLHLYGQEEPGGTVYLVADPLAISALGIAVDAAVADHPLPTVELLAGGRRYYVRILVLPADSPAWEALAPPWMKL